MDISLCHLLFLTTIPDHASGQKNMFTGRELLDAKPETRDQRASTNSYQQEPTGRRPRPRQSKKSKWPQLQPLQQRAGPGRPVQQVAVARVVCLIYDIAQTCQMGF
jgi:hypothetical protein